MRMEGIKAACTGEFISKFFVKSGQQEGVKSRSAWSDEYWRKLSAISCGFKVKSDDWHECLKERERVKFFN